MNSKQTLTRRHFLRGLGAGIALPSLVSLPGSRVLHATTPNQPLATTETGAPLRLGFVYFPNGAIQDKWWPEAEGNDFTLNQTMRPLENVRNQLQVLSGLDHVNATPGPDGAGDHARASGTYLTGVRVRKTAGADIQAGVSIDQLIANRIGHLTRFPSLELSCDAIRKSGSCDSGYSCAYQYNLAWRSETQPVPPEPNPRLLFERLFGAGKPGERHESLTRRQQQKRSILDFVLEDARALKSELGLDDTGRLDEYLSSIRDIEKRIEAAERLPAPDPEMETPEGVPTNFEDHIDVMFDMLTLAFQTDSTRVATFLLHNEGSNRTFPEIGIIEGHHYLTHHKNQQAMIDKVADIDRWYVGKLARFLNRLEAIEDVDGNSILHNSMILYGSGNSDGNRHTHVNLPLVLAGRGGGKLSESRFKKFGDLPMSNFLLGLGHHMGATDLKRLGDSTGVLTGV
jgi:hypothetical protein